MLRFNKKTKVILIAVGLIVIAGIGSVITACTMSKVNNDNDDNKVVATESSTETTEQATEELTELPTEEATEKATKKATEKSTEKKNSSSSSSSKSDKNSSSSKNSSSKNSSFSKNSSNNSNTSSNDGTVTYYTTITTGGGSTGDSGNDNSTSNNTSNSNNNNSVDNNNTASNKNNINTNNNTPSKTWYEAEYKYVNHPAETEEVWVVDKATYTYEEPVYETHDRTLCNTCGADITENVGDHGYNHMINGENASYHNEWVNVQVGTKKVTVPEEGHYETKVLKDAWTEKLLIREAGYY